MANRCYGETYKQRNKRLETKVLDAEVVFAAGLCFATVLYLTQKRFDTKLFERIPTGCHHCTYVLKFPIVPHSVRTHQQQRRTGWIWERGRSPGKVEIYQWVYIQFKQDKCIGEKKEKTEQEELTNVAVGVALGKHGLQILKKVPRKSFQLRSVNLYHEWNKSIDSTYGMEQQYGTKVWHKYRAPK